MATRFEIVLQGANEPELRAAGEEALDEIDRLENQLSLFRPGSEIARVNALAARQPVRVSPPLFQLLLLARKLNGETGGLFDITVAPLMRSFGFMYGQGQIPPQQELLAARECVGMQHVCLDEASLTVRFSREGMMLDLGAIGKGYAIEQAAMILREAGVEHALVHGGTSTVFAIGKPLDADAWKIAVEGPHANDPGGGIVGESSAETPQTQPSAGSESERKKSVRAIVRIEDEALSVSAVWGRFFESGGKKFGHVLDPRSGEPVFNAVMAAVVVPSATESDALSTALLVAGPAGHDAIAGLRERMRTLVVAPGKDEWVVASRGIRTV
jgi:thiamine biosynthesis lipoprotein